MPESKFDVNDEVTEMVKDRLKQAKSDIENRPIDGWTEREAGRFEGRIHELEAVIEWLSEKGGNE